MFAVMAALYSPFSVDETMFEATPYQTASGLAGIRYVREIDGERMEYYIFGGEDAELPQLFAVVIKMCIRDRLEPVADSFGMVFLWGVVITSALEYLTSYVMEKMFHTRWWDYSRYRFNLNGRICLLNSTLFGLMCLFVVYVIHPPILLSLIHI